MEYTPTSGKLNQLLLDPNHSQQKKFKNLRKISGLLIFSKVTEKIVGEYLK